MVRLVLFLDAAQDRNRVLNGGLIDEHLLEAPLEGRILLDVFAVLIERGRADHPQFAAGQHRLEHVAGVHRRIATGSRTNDRVQLIDECDDLAFGFLDLVEDGLQPFLELAAVLRTGHHGTEVEGDEGLALQRGRHIAFDDASSETFDDGRLADTGVADEHRVVLGPSGEHLNGATDLLIPTDDGIDLAFAGARGEIDAIFLQGLESPFGIR